MPHSPSMKLRALALSAAVGVFALTACSSGASSKSSAVPASAPATQAADPSATATEVPWSESDEVVIALQGRSVSAPKTGVDVSGSNVTITAAGTYRLSGTLSDGQIVVDSSGDGLVRLVLDGVDIHSSRTAAIAVTDAGEVMIVLADGSQNVLSDAATFAPDPTTQEPNATLFSTADLTISGGGALTVDGAFNDGIASKDGLTLAGGTIAVKAPDDGIRGKDYLVVDGGSLTVTAGGDALKSDNEEDAAKGYVTVNAGTLNLTSGGDGISAATSVVVAGGDLKLMAGGGNTRTVAAGTSAKGVKGTALVQVDNGTLSIDAADDAINSDDRVVINGGQIEIATGDDGVHADASLKVNGGSVMVTASYEGLESLALTLAGGDVRVVSRDDGINAAGGVDRSGAVAPGGARPDTFAAGTPTLTISGGRIIVDSGGDGLDVNGSGSMSDGTVIVNGPSGRGNSAVDYDGTFNISGGMLVAAGSSSMLRAPTATSSQASLLKTFATQAAGTVIHIASTDGRSVLTFAPTKAFQSIVFSSPDMAKTSTYQVSLGGTATGANTDGLYNAGAYSGGASVA